MEDLVTVEALEALAEVEATEAAVVELSLATVLPRLPPAVKFLARNVAMSPDRSAGGISLINWLKYLLIINQECAKNCPKTGVFQRTKAAVQQCSSSTVQVNILLILENFHLII